MRKEKRLRQVDLARAIGVGQTTVANYEQAIRFPDEKILLAIADFFSVSLDYLLGRSDAPYQESADAGPHDSNTDAEQSVDPLAADYLACLLEGNRSGAFQLMEEAVGDGMPVRTAYVEVLEPALKEAGRMWERGEIHVAREHYITEATEILMARLHRFLNSPPKRRGTVICMSVSGEQHRIGMKMISDILEEEGWSSRYIGVNVPTDALIVTIKETSADVLAVSATMEFHIDIVANMIYRLHSSHTGKPLKIITGGQAFNKNPDRWKRIGADGYAANLYDAIDMINSFE